MSELKADDTGNAIVPVLACVLHQLCLRNDRLPLNQKGLSKFHALRPPAITIKDYLQRVAKYAACSGECFVLALIYIDRIIQSNPLFVVNSLNIHRLLITSIMLAAKFFDDQYFNNAFYAKVGGVPCNEINSLEVEFLFLCNFSLFVNTETYTQYYTELCNHAHNSQNTCSCCTGPRVPTLHIPSFHHISMTNTIESLPIEPIPLCHHASLREYFQVHDEAVRMDQSPMLPPQQMPHQMQTQSHLQQHLMHHPVQLMSGQMNIPPPPPSNPSQVGGYYYSPHDPQSLGIHGGVPGNSAYYPPQSGHPLHVLPHGQMMPHPHVHSHGLQNHNPHNLQHSSHPHPHAHLHNNHSSIPRPPPNQPPNNGETMINSPQVGVM